MQKKVSSFGEGPHAGGARKEDSGLIDLDALMRQAADSERDVSRSAAAVAPVNVPVPVPAVQAVATSAAAATAPPTQRTPRGPTLAPPVMTPAPGTVRAPSVAKATAAQAVAGKPAHREPDESLAGVSTPTASAAVVTARADAADAGAAAAPTNELDPARASLVKPARSSRRGYAVAAAVAVLLCASVVGYRASRHDASQATKASTAARVETAANAAPRAATEPKPAAATPGAPEIGASDLPSAPSPADEHAAARTVPAGRNAAGGARAHDQHALPVDPKVTALVLPDSPTRDPSDLGAAMRGAVGAKTAVDPATVAGPASSARTLRPSPGAVVGALNGVLPGARACLGEDDPVTLASVTFKNDGAVSRVDISGDRPTNGCVRASLSKAHIEPFADDTFVTRVTVRP
jgi:hypothetical protein